LFQNGDLTVAVDDDNRLAAFSPPYVPTHAIAQLADSDFDHERIVAK